MRDGTIGWSRQCSRSRAGLSALMRHAPGWRSERYRTREIGQRVEAAGCGEVGTREDRQEARTCRRIGFTGSSILVAVGHRQSREPLAQLSSKWSIQAGVRQRRPPELQFVLMSATCTTGPDCGILAVGRCLSCGRAFCQSHQATGSNVTEIVGAGWFGRSAYIASVESISNRCAPCQYAQVEANRRAAEEAEATIQVEQRRRVADKIEHINTTLGTWRLPTIDGSHHPGKPLAGQLRSELDTAIGTIRALPRPLPPTVRWSRETNGPEFVGPGRPRLNGEERDWRWGHGWTIYHAFEYTKRPFRRLAEGVFCGWNIASHGRSDPEQVARVDPWIEMFVGRTNVTLTHVGWTEAMQGTVQSRTLLSIEEVAQDIRVEVELNLRTIVRAANEVANTNKNGY